MIFHTTNDDDRDDHHDEWVSIPIDTELETKLIRYTEIAATFFEMSVAFIALYEPNGSLSFKSIVGNAGFCLSSSDPLYKLILYSTGDCVIVDMVNHVVTAESVLNAPFYRFYASTPIRIDGVVIGQLCILDTFPREVEDFQLKERNFLRDAADLIAHRIKNVTAAKRVSNSIPRLRSTHSSSTIATDDTYLSSMSEELALDDPVELPISQKQQGSVRSNGVTVLIRRFFSSFRW